MKTILVTLPVDRNFLGQLSLMDEDGVCEFGPCPVDGKSDNAAAIAAGNPSRDPTLPYGNTPLGEYVGSISYIEGTPQNRRSYGQPDSDGQIPTIDLMPRHDPDSQGWKGYVAGRRGLKIHSGDLNGSGELRVTHGCLRTEQADMTALLSRLDNEVSWNVSVQEKQEIPT